MNRTYLTCLAATALALTCAYGYAQNAATANATDPKASAVDPQDKSKGQDVVGNPAPDPAPATTGQNKQTGNDLVGDKSAQNQASTNPSFSTLDTKNQGYLLAGDVKNYKWLAANFARCDSDHDGHVSPLEYAACAK